MKKFILSIFVIVSFGFYAISQNTNNSSAINTDNNLIPISKTSSSSKNNTIAKTANSNTNPIIKNTNVYNDGTYIGDSAFAYNDNVQVKVIISSGKIKGIQFVHYPTHGRSGNISSFSLPTLKQEAIQAQSANINAVSGASYTSPAFIQSLTSALNQAKA